MEQCKQFALPDQEYCVAHINIALGLTPQEVTLMKELREKIGNEDTYKRILFNSPESVLNWLEEIARRDIDRATDEIRREKSGNVLNRDLTKLHETLTKRLLKILEIKTKKKGKKKLGWEDFSPADIRLITED